MAPTYLGLLSLVEATSDTSFITEADAFQAKSTRADASSRKGAVCRAEAKLP